MALRGYKQKTDTIQAGDQTVTVRALTLADVTILVDGYWSEIKSIYDYYVSIESDVEPDAKFNRMILECVRIAPDLAAAIIAVSAGEPDEVETAKSLPFTVQVDALVKITTLTLTEAGGLGNFSAVLRRAAESVRSALPVTASPPPPLSVPDPLGTH